ncbi:MAG: hypothetical protein IMZ43_02915 [Thermoplasmata archaeon]|nr:hypothetical protein [Thermoplasmata archaeon]
MKTKLLLGSIGAVTILILVSFTNVVGVQSTTSDSVSESPLFNIRTQKAINEKSNTILTSNYLGKGLNALPFPLRDNRTALIQKVIERIAKMDEKAMFAFIAMNIARMNIGNQRKDISILEISTALNQLKSNRDILTNYIDDIKNNNAPRPFTLAGPGCQWRPGGWLIEIVLLVLVLLFYNIAQFFTLAFCTPPYTYNCLLHM